MRRTLQSSLDSLTSPHADSSTGMLRPPSCGYDPRAVAASPRGVDSLRARIYACYGWAQSRVLVDVGDTLDRLTILGALGRTDAPDVRRRLFLSLDPVWRSMNGANEAASPYRVLIAGKMAGGKGPPSLEQASASGVPGASHCSSLQSASAVASTSGEPEPGLDVRCRASAAKSCEEKKWQCASFSIGGEG